MKNIIEQNFAKLEDWIVRRGFILFRTKHKKVVDEVDFERNIIFINIRSTPLHQFYSALHECGHIIVRARKNYRKNFKASVEYNEEGKGKLNYRCLVEEIEEEILAWREGEKLCNKLNIELDTDKYYTYSARWVMTYIVKAGLGKEHLLGQKYKIEKAFTVNENEASSDEEKELDSHFELCYNAEKQKH